MAKLHFIYATMGAGKSAALLQVEFNYRERGHDCLLLTPACDMRAGPGMIASRIGLSRPAEIFDPHTDLFAAHLTPAARRGVACVLVDEAQFLTPDQVDALAWAVDTLDLPVMAYGLRTDFRGDLFPGTAALMARADEMREMRTICHCGKRATMVARLDASGHPTLTGPQVHIGGNDTYVPLCRKHWTDAHRTGHISAPEHPIAKDAP